MPQNQIKEMKQKTEKSIEHLRGTLQGIRTGRAHPALVEDIKVDYFGTLTPIKQMATVTVPESRQLVITPWDKTALKAIEKAIQSSSLGVTPKTDGDSVRVTLPELTKERRQELSKLVNKYAEEARVAIRNIRRDVLEAFKKMEKAGDISEDEHKKLQKEVQDHIDGAIKKVDQMAQEKEKEILND
ncbi:ribosome recycling factor [Thermanaerovibrio velox DSM 12556]|uniref:Ribosome-recycling factor n=1 Tax=Thermanaerovibrio velox DSM 12556 TaxID=926567 RepID=H0US87_9BACT|nr:ribosome recycling factor [Thermanaerovibrio velox]EHM10176.1 ribosome recycling factor [Thermanaerovibrio velox DSM 12556]